MSTVHRSPANVEVQPLDAEAASKLTFHPVADFFPLLHGDAFDALVADIGEHGLREPIWLHRDERIIDGRNRYRACIEAGRELKTQTYIGPDDGLLDFVVSMNLQRRHLDETQRGMVGARLATRPWGGQEDSAKGQICPSADTIPQAAARLNVSKTTVKSARKILERGCAKLIEACDHGKVAVSDAARIVDLPTTEQDRIIERVTAGLAKTLAQAHRTLDIQRQKRAIAEGTAKMPDGVFEVISIDPPWPYGNEDDYDPEYFCGTTPYPEMSLDEIRAIELPAAPDCVLWLWTTHHFMRHAFPLLDAWGFKEKAIVTWDKGSIGMGSYLRSQSEFVIMAVRGHPLVDLTNQPTIIRAPRREHSRKPDEFFEMVESLCIGRRLDFFSRARREGWEQFGNDPDKFKGAV